MDCTTCAHAAKQRSTSCGVEILLHECRHPKVFGLLACEKCRRFTLMENFSPVIPSSPLKLRCPRDGCRHVQTMPSDDDWRVGFLGHCPEEQRDAFSLTPPEWCPGYLAKESPKDAATPKKKLTKKQRREAEHPTLF